MNDMTNDIWGKHKCDRCGKRRNGWNKAYDCTRKSCQGIMVPVGECNIHDCRNPAEYGKTCPACSAKVDAMLDPSIYGGKP